MFLDNPLNTLRGRDGMWAKSRTVFVIRVDDRQVQILGGDPLAAVRWTRFYRHRYPSSQVRMDEYQ